MKAQDYFEKYKSTILTEEVYLDLFKEMNDEVKLISKQRNSATDSTMISILKEQNQKWNKLCVLLEKEYGQEVLVRNGYINYWKKHISKLT